MLSRALAAGAPAQPCPAELRSSKSSFVTSNYPFPCLLNPEDDEAARQSDSDTQQRDQESEDVFEDWDSLENDLGSFRVASNTTKFAATDPDVKLVRQHSARLEVAGTANSPPRCTDTIHMPTSILSCPLMADSSHGIKTSREP